MTTANIQSFFSAKVTLKGLDGVTGQTLWLSSREPFDDQNRVYIPILRSIQGLGQTVGLDLPDRSSGSITIEDEWGSFAYSRKFSDILERYTIVDQPIEIYRSFVELDNLVLGDEETLIFRGRMKEWSAATDSDPPQVTITVESTYIEDRLMTKPVDQTAFPNCPESSIGKNIPIIFGYGVEIDPIRISADYERDTAEIAYADYVYGVTLGDTHINAGVTSLLIRNSEGNYKEMSNPVDVDTPAFSSTGTATVAWDFYDRDASHTGKQDDVAIPLAYTDGTTNYALIGGTVTLKGNYGGAWTTDSTFIVEIYERGPKQKKNPRREPIASVEIEKNEWLSDFRNTAYFEMEFRFEEPVFLTSPNGYSINFTQTLNDTETDYAELGCVNSPTTYYRRGYYDGSTKRPNRWQKRTSGAPANVTPLWKLYAAFWEPSIGPIAADINADGIGHQKIGINQHVFVDATQAVCDLTKIDPILVVNGIVDDDDGTITTLPGVVLQNPFWILKLLTKTYDGADWVFNTTDYDPVAFAASVTQSLDPGQQWFVLLAGRSEGAVTLERLIQQILSNSMARLVTRNNGKMAYSFYGYRAPKSFEFTDDNCLVLGIRELGTQTVVNRVQAYFNRMLSTVTSRALAAESSFKNYRGSIDYGYTSDQFSAIAATASNAVFGSRTLNDRRIGFDWTRWEYGETIARYFLTLFPFPHRVIQVRAVFQEFYELELLDAGEIISSRLPAYFGTDPASKPPSYEGEVVDIKRGHEYRRAQRYRVQIVDRDYDFSNQAAPAILFTLRITRPDLGDMS